jgi:hypothetical protein
VPVLLRWHEAQVPGASVDWVVTVPETVGPLCIIVKLTTVVPIPPEEPVLGFESTPVPSKVGGGPDGPLLAEFGPGMPVPAPQETVSAASAAAEKTIGTGFMSEPRSPSRW